MLQRGGLAVGRRAHEKMTAVSTAGRDRPAVMGQAPVDILESGPAGSTCYCVLHETP
jgi:hypothetical protein